jgi:hyperpolarization activated cyclic nucleotide-gated potassium channel 1
VALAMHHGAAQKIPFFKGRDNVFVSTIIPFLQHLYVNKEELIYEEGEYADEMYFIQKGKVNFVYGQECHVFKSLVKGSYFGDIEVI